MSFYKDDKARILGMMQASSVAAACHKVSSGFRDGALARQGMESRRKEPLHLPIPGPDAFEP